MRRREFITLLGGAVAAWPLAARAQQSERVRRIGVLMGLAENDPEAQPRVVAFREELLKQGWAEERNVQIDFRWAVGDARQIRAFAKELIELQPDVLVAHSTPVTAALLHQTHTIRIVFVQVGDPVGSGFVQSFARPGGNVTGFTNHDQATIGGKWLELLKQIAPSVTRVMLIFNPETMPIYALFLHSVQAAAPSFAIKLVPEPVRDISEIERAVSAFAREPNGGLLVIPDIFTASHREPIIAQAARHRLPAIYPFRYFATSGGLISYGIEPVDLYRQAAAYVDRILRGAKPGTLPVQAPTKIELVINLKTAKALGLDVRPLCLPAPTR
jgi:putative ABC transport system substrate-binding protein